MRLFYYKTPVVYKLAKLSPTEIKPGATYYHHIYPFLRWCDKGKYIPNNTGEKISSISKVYACLIFNFNEFLTAKNTLTVILCVFN